MHALKTHQCNILDNAFSDVNVGLENWMPEALRSELKGACTAAALTSNLSDRDPTSGS